MSLSNPTANDPNPATRWFEWNGGKGVVRYYDKAAKENVTIDEPFTFVLLDELSSIGGWHEPSKSGIFSNAIYDTTQDALVVKAFKGGTLAEGLYRSIKDRVVAAGGYFTAVKYIAYKGDDGEFQIGAIKLKGSGLGAWMDFSKGKKLYEMAIRIDGSTEKTTGGVLFHTPNFVEAPLAEDTKEIAVALDVELQAYLEGYLARTTHDQAVTDTDHDYDDEPDVLEETDGPRPIDDSDIPF